eukprot:gnl/TRDRNA2_/TRDRNA2_175215_c0_seq6.p1 gnl/TRDRNA2_/TRDRNA2_175215_c0~~gnl/TRDRNA2_/TRDRNA2_175215_c0_seq6.p1  ORF type:complete len:554 (+),score=126.37 gnl/TRDRNA2_/TRDRNA2_175215_c0_seq6:96-1757(+)
MEAQTQSMPSRSRATAVFLAFFFVGMIGTGVIFYHNKSQASAEVESSEEPGPAGILLHQIRQLSGAPNAAEQELALRTSLGHIYHDQGRYAQAVKQYSLAHDTAVQLGGAERLAPTLQSRGKTLLRQGRLESARRDLETAYVLVDKKSDLEQAIAVLHHLGDVRRDLGHSKEALEFYERAVELATAELHDEDLLSNKVASLKTDMAETHARKGQLEEALTLFRAALKHLEKAGRQGFANRLEVETQLAVTQSLLGSALHEKGEIAQGMEYYTKAMRQQARTLRPDHPDLAFTRMSISRAQRDSGEISSSMETLNAVEKTLRDGAQEGPDLSRCLTMKADLLRELKRYPEARSTIDEASKHQEVEFGGETNPEVAVTLNNVGSILHDEGKFQDALEKYLSALQVNMATVGHDHPETAATHNSLGTLYQDAGDDASAQKHFEKCLEIQLTTVGTRSPDMATSYNNIATILFRRGELEDAARLLKKALTVLDDANIPDSNPDRAIFKENLQEIVERIHKRSKDSQEEGNKSAAKAEQPSALEVHSQGGLVRREVVV